MREAIVLLPGVTADERKRAFARDQLASRLSAEVLLPPLAQWLGVAWCARQLSRFLRDVVGAEAGRPVGVVAWVSGGLILRALHARAPVVPLTQAVYVRSPIQEQVPSRLVARHGRLPLLFARGRMMLDLAAGRYDALPYPPARRSGLLVEHGVSRLAKELGLRAEDFGSLDAALAPRMPRVDLTLHSPLSHDDVYTSALLLDQVAAFLETGSFGLGPEEGRPC